MLTEEEGVNVSGSRMIVTLMCPGGTGMLWPGIVLCHHREGVDEFTLDAARRLTMQGYVVAVPNFYHRRPENENWNVSRKTMQDTEVVADLKATYDFLARHPFVRADAVGIVGHCMGGRTAFLGGATIRQFKAIAILYGGHIFKTEGHGMPAPNTLIKDIQAPVLALYGNQDHVICIDEIKRLECELKAANIKCEFHIFENAGHAFQDFTRPEMYRKDISEAAWTALVAFLQRALT